MYGQVCCISGKKKIEEKVVILNQQSATCSLPFSTHKSR